MNHSFGNIESALGLLFAATVACACNSTDAPEGVEPKPFVDFASAEADPNPNALALDGEFIYVSVPDGDLGFIQRISKSNASVTLLTTRGQRTLELAVDDSRVYFTDGAGGPWSVPKSGGAASGVSLIGSQGGGVWGVAVDADRVYWTRWLTDSIGQIETAAKDGSDLRQLASSEALCLRLALDEANVYCGDQAGQVWAVPKLGGDLVHLGGASRLADFLVVDDTYVYFTSGGIPDPDGRLNRVAKAGGETEVLAELGGHPAGLTLRDGRLYVGTDDGILSIATDGSDRELLVRTEWVGNDVESDSEKIYWISDLGGVFRHDL